MNRLMAQLRRDTSFSQQLIGGGAGDETDLRSTQVVVQGEALSGAAAMLHVFGRKPWGIGVGHGLRPVSPPMTVTRVDGNTVLELNGRPAIEDREIILRFLERFDDRVKEVAVLHYLDELTQEEIAAATGWSRQTVIKKLAYLAERAETLRASLLDGNDSP